MLLKISLLSALCGLLCSGAAHAQLSVQSSQRPHIGLKIGQYRYTSAQTRDTFNGNSLSISPTYSRPIEADTKGRLRFDFSFNSSSEGDNRLIMVPVGVGYRRTAGQGETLPYFGGSLNLAPVYLKVPDQNKDGKLSLAAGGSAFVGVQFKQRYILEARYFLLSKVRGYDVSGFDLSAGLRF